MGAGIGSDYSPWTWLPRKAQNRKEEDCHGERARPNPLSPWGHVLAMTARSSGSSMIPL